VDDEVVGRLTRRNARDEPGWFRYGPPTWQRAG
jgi:hypothetical protein